MSPKGRPPWLPFVVAPAVAVVALILVLAVMTKWAVLAVTILAALIGLGLWTKRRGFSAIEIVAFLIHFDGLEFSIISVGRISAAVLTVVIIRKLVVDRWRPPAVQFRNWAPVWLLLCWVTVSGLWSVRVGGWIKAFLMLYLAFVFFCVTSMLVESHKDIQRFLRAFWVGGLFGSGAGILALFLGTRSEGLIGDPNFFGLVEAAMIPLTVYYLRHATERRERWFYMITLAVVLAGAAGAGSRSGLIGASIAIVATMVSKPGVSMGKRARIAGVALLITPVAFAIGFVMNPANLQRGFADRGAGRLDFWNATTDMIAERPILGQGFGQISYKIPQRLLITPGVQLLDERREAVSSHNTWLDMTGDLGVVGVSLFLLCFIVAGWSLLRPRWPYLSDLSTTVFVMMLPVLSSSMFLGLLNNKLAWSIMGLAAALSIPSDDARWPKVTGDEQEPLTPPGDQDADQPLYLSPGSSNGHSTALVPYEPEHGRVHLPVRHQELLANPLFVDQMPEVGLAKWDVRITRSALRTVLAVALVAMIAMFTISSSFPATFSVSSGFMVPELKVSSPREVFGLPTERSQQALVLVKSEAFAANLADLSGIDRSVQQVLDGITVEKPRMGGLVTITFTDHDKRVVEQAAPYLLAALNKIYTDARNFGMAGVDDQARPVNPGERNVYTGPPLVAAFSEPVIEGAKPKVMWMTLVAGATGAIITLGLFLSRCRRPRVTSHDDMLRRTSTPVWTHVSNYRRQPLEATVAQMQQVAVTLAEASGRGEALRRILVTPPERSRASRSLTVGLAAALVARGERVVVVDADVERPWLALRLDPAARMPKADEPLDLRKVQERMLPRGARRLLAGRADDLRLLHGSQIFDAGARALSAQRLGEFDEGITVLVLAPPAGSDVGVLELAQWAEIMVVPMRDGLTTTEAAQMVTARDRLLGRARSGIVMVAG